MIPDTLLPTKDPPALLAGTAAFGFARLDCTLFTCLSDRRARALACFCKAAVNVSETPPEFVQRLPEPRTPLCGRVDIGRSVDKRRRSGEEENIYEENIYITKHPSCVWVPYLGAPASHFAYVREGLLPP